MELYESKYTGEEMDALFDKANYKVGTYTGDKNASKFINLGFTPSAVMVTNLYGATYFQSGSTGILYGGLALNGYPLQTSDGRKVVEIVENGFKVFYDNSTTTSYVQSNLSDASVNPFRYIAFR
jgi:hypothetical protein